jgi:hypothetical protein
MNSKVKPVKQGGYRKKGNIKEETKKRKQKKVENEQTAKNENLKEA